MLFTVRTCFACICCSHCTMHYTITVTFVSTHQFLFSSSRELQLRIIFTFFFLFRPLIARTLLILLLLLLLFCIDHEMMCMCVRACVTFELNRLHSCKNNCSDRYFSTHIGLQIEHMPFRCQLPYYVCIGQREDARRKKPRSSQRSKVRYTLFTAYAIGTGHTVAHCTKMAVAY